MIQDLNNLSVARDIENDEYLFIIFVPNLPGDFFVGRVALVNPTQRLFIFMNVGFN